jgi:hypothetical protein
VSQHLAPNDQAGQPANERVLRRKDVYDQEPPAGFQHPQYFKHAFSFRGVI